jgi:hypothetical protein
LPIDQIVFRENHFIGLLAIRLFRNPALLSMGATWKTGFARADR